MRLKNYLPIETVAAVVATNGYSKPIAHQAVISAAKILGLRIIGTAMHLPTGCTGWLLDEAKAAAEMLVGMEQRRSGRT